MNDMWDNLPKEEPSADTVPTPAESVPPVDNETSLNDMERPAGPTQQEEAAQPTEPAQPPLNGWSGDGSYRYVPPRPQPPAQPTPPATQQPFNGGYGWPTQPTSTYTPPPVQQPPKQPKKNNGWVVLIALLAAVAVVGCVVLGVFAVMRELPEKPSAETSAPTTSEDKPENSGVTNAPSLEISQWDDNDGGLSNKEVVNRNFDATVVLTAYTQSTNFQFGQSSLMEAGGSSGIIMSADGYIITNWHCVINENTGKAYDRIDVTTYDGKTYEDAQVIGADESTDLAVIKIKASGLTAAEFGDSSALSVGDRVVALGNAAGLSWTATFGYVSALARDVYDDTGYAIKCLQVDAAINYGNSGGPLLNNQGLVVGINSAKIAASGYEGLGFSIPINEAKEVIDSLLKNGYVKGRVALGITGQTVSSGMYQGFMITEISDGSSLQGTTAQAGDLIVAVDDVKVTDYGTLRSALAKHKVGDKVTLSLLRSDRYTGQVASHKVTVTLKEQTAN